MKRRLRKVYCQLLDERESAGGQAYPSIASFPRSVSPRLNSISASLRSELNSLPMRSRMDEPPASRWTTRPLLTSSIATDGWDRAIRVNCVLM